MSMFDILVLTVVLLVFSISMLFGATLWANISPSLNQTFTASSPTGTLDSNTAYVMQSTDSSMLALDSLFIFLAFGSFVAVLITSYFVESHPIYFVLSLFMLLFSVGLTALFSNIFGEFQTSPLISSAASNYPFLEMFWLNAPTVILIFGAVTAIIILARIKGRNNYGGY